jgi:glycosyltransferase involved in cell wall biosynthesis
MADTASFDSGEIKRCVLVTDAWQPQVNGVVRTLNTTTRVLRALGVEVHIISPQEFNTVPCPTYPSIQLAVLPGEKVRRRITELAPHALHVATEGPLGWAARNFAVELGIPFTTAVHTRFPEYVYARLALPISITYRYLRWFHSHSKAIMVPTPMVKRDLESHGFKHVQLWSRGVDTEVFQPPPAGFRLPPSDSSYPIFLYAGRVAVEKNVEAFLSLDLPGQKWVVGDGPALEGLQVAYPDVRYFGFLNQTELAKVYQQSNVFVFPSKTDTFGLVLLEAMATGLPVAAYPVSGPIDVVSTSGAGVLDEDLRSACLRALEIDPAVARAHAEKYSWTAATQMFASNLHYISPFVFAEGVREWSNARFLDDGSNDLVSLLPRHLVDWLDKTGGVEEREETVGGRLVRRAVQAAAAAASEKAIPLIISPAENATSASSSSSSSSTTSSTSSTNSSTPCLRAATSEDPFLNPAGNGGPSLTLGVHHFDSTSWGYLMVVCVGATMVGNYVVSFFFKARGGKSLGLGTTARKASMCLTADDGRSVGSITPPLSPASTCSHSNSFHEDSLW